MQFVLTVHLQGGRLQQALLLHISEERHVLVFPAGLSGVAAVARRVLRAARAASREYSGPYPTHSARRARAE